MESGEIAETQCSVRNASEASHLANHLEHIEVILLGEIEAGEELWVSRKRLFKELIFLPTVERQIRSLQRGDPHILQLGLKLFALNRYARSWKTGSFNPAAIGPNVSPESASTMRDYGQTRIFSDAKGTNFNCEWHMRLTPGAWRLHFSPDATARKIRVCYVGEGLPTKSDPT
jgi:hypothetical protein